MSDVHLITGVGGFVASYLARYLISQGRNVIGTIRWNEDLDRIRDLDMETVPMDLIDLSACMRCIKMCRPDYVYHLAAQSYVPDSIVNPIATLMINTVGTSNVLEAIRLVGCDPIVYIASSSEVYGDVSEDEIPIKETNQFRPANPYAGSKVGADAMAYVYYKCFGFKVIRARWFTHFGPDRTMMSAETSFAKQIALIEVGKQEPVVRVGNLDSIRAIADVRDAVRGIYLAVQKCQPGEVYNIGGDKTMSIGDILDYFISLSPMKDKIIIKRDPSLVRQADVTLQIPDTTKFKEATGWRPEIPFEKTLLDILNYWRNKVASNLLMTKPIM